MLIKPGAVLLMSKCPATVITPSSVQYSDCVRAKGVEPGVCSWRRSRTALNRAGRLLNDFLPLHRDIGTKHRDKCVALYCRCSALSRSVCLAVYRCWDAHIQSQTNHCWAATAMQTPTESLSSISLPARLGWNKHRSRMV